MFMNPADPDFESKIRFELFSNSRSIKLGSYVIGFIDKSLLNVTKKASL